MLVTVLCDRYHSDVAHDPAESGDLLWAVAMVVVAKDLVILLVPLQAVLWPQVVITGWTVSAVAASDVLLISWASMVGAFLAIALGPGRTGEARRAETGPRPQAALGRDSLADVLDARADLVADRARAGACLIWASIDRPRRSPRRLCSCSFEDGLAADSAVGDAQGPHLDGSARCRARFGALAGDVDDRVPGGVGVDIRRHHPRERETW